MATYTPTSHLTNHAGSTSSSSYVTLFTASASNPTYITGSFSQSNGTGSGLTVNFLITPTTGTTNVAGAQLFSISNQASSSTAGVAINSVSVFSMTASSTLLSTQLSSSITAISSSLNHAGGFLFDKLLIPPGYLVQVQAASGTSTIFYGIVQEEIY